MEPGIDLYTMSKEPIQHFNGDNIGETFNNSFCNDGLFLRRLPQETRDYNS